MKKVLIVVNPVSGAGSALKLHEGIRAKNSLIAALAKEIGAASPETWPVLRTNADGSWRQELEAFLRAGPSAGDLVAVAAVGGDGTLSETATVLHDTRAKRVALVPFPGGRGNDFFRGITGYAAEEGDYWEWAAKCDKWELRQVDMGSANGRVYLNMASLGFGGRVVEKALMRQAAWSRTAMVYQVEGALAFLQALTSSLGNCEMKCDGVQSYRGRFFGAFVGNGRANGRGLFWTNQAKLDDGKLDTIVFGKPSLLEMLSSLNAVKRQKLPTFRHTSGRAAEIIFHFDKPTPLELDGEFVGSQLTHEFKALPGVLNVWVPKV